MVIIDMQRLVAGLEGRQVENYFQSVSLVKRKDLSDHVKLYIDPL